MGTPWSPPAWMKANDSLIGGRMKDDPRVYQAYADYLVKFVQAYEAEGVPVYGLTIQNEPQNRHPSGYPGTDLPVRQAAEVIARLGPALQAAGPRHQDLRLRPQLVAAPRDAESTPPGEDPERDYPADLLESTAGRWLAGTAYHCYAGDQKRMTELHQRFPDKDIWFTECSGSHGPTDPPAQVFSDTLKWHARNLTLGVTRNWASRWSPGTSRCAPTAARTTAAATPAPAWSPSRTTAPSPATRSTTRSATSPASWSPAPGGWPARPTAPPAGTACR